MWFIGILALAGLAYIISEPRTPSASATKVTAANVNANWPTHTVIDTNKFRALGIPVNTPTQYEGVAPNVIAAMTQANPAVSTTFLGTVPLFIAAQLGMGQRVWIGSPVQDETSQTPSAYLPIYVGSDPPAAGGFVEVLS